MFNFTRVAVLTLASILAAYASVAFSQDYPARPIHLLATEPGSSTDTYGRLMGAAISGPLGQPIIVENRPSTVQPDVLAKATPDGYTAGLAGGAFWLTPLIQKTTYDPIKDFAPISTIVTFPYVLVVNPKVPASTLQQLIDYAKSKPGTLNIGATASPGGESFLAAELLKSMAGINLVRVAFKSNPPALVATAAGEVDMMFNSVAATAPMIKAGKIKSIGITSLKPFQLAPDVPPMTTSGLPGFEVLTIIGMLAPGGTPAPMINRLNQEVVRALNSEDIKTKLLNAGVDIAPATPEQFGQRIKSEMTKWEKVIKDAGITAN